MHDCPCFAPTPNLPSKRGREHTTRVALPYAAAVPARCMVAISVSASRAQRAPLNRKPWISLQPSRRSRSSCCSVSTPSAVVAMPRLALRPATARMIASELSSLLMLRMNEPSILMRSRTRRRNSASRIRTRAHAATRLAA